MISNMIPNFQANNNFNRFSNNFINFGFGPNSNANIPGLVMDGQSQKDGRNYILLKIKKKQELTNFQEKLMLLSKQLKV